MKAVKSAWPVLVAAAIFVVGLIPYFRGEAQTIAALYYGPLFFAVLLGASIMLLLLVTPRSGTEKESRDYRVTQYTIRVALGCGIGAVIVAVLLLLALLLDWGTQVSS